MTNCKPSFGLHRAAGRELNVFMSVSSSEVPVLVDAAPFVTFSLKSSQFFSLSLIPDTILMLTLFLHTLI